jgi:hypothetical protein
MKKLKTKDNKPPQYFRSEYSLDETTLVQIAPHFVGFFVCGMMSRFGYD